jgi:hypothetical protein
MTKNLGNLDRIARVIVVVALGCCAVLAPFSLVVRLVAFALPALYVAGSALTGTCLGYSLLGLSTCPMQRKTS